MASPEEALAMTANGTVPMVWPGIGSKEIVWLFRVTRKLCVTGVAAPQALFPDCVAWSAHVPAATSVTRPEDTVQTVFVVEARATGRPDEAVALGENGAVPMIWAATGPKAMVWLSRPTEKCWVTAGAAA
jgi:hypothetical protein